MKFFKKIKNQCKMKEKSAPLEDIKISKTGSCAFTILGCISFAAGYFTGYSCSDESDDECCYHNFCLDRCIFMDCCSNECDFY
jgi:hypothetical protein